MQSLFWQATIFSSVAIGFVVLSVWWLYFSPLKTARPMPDVALSTRDTTVVAVLLALAGFNFWAGGVWDGSKHIKTGLVPAGADFLWAPHIMIYSSFLIGMFIAMASISRIAGAAWSAGVRDPRQWVRRDPYLGAVAVASVFQLLSIPGDAIWHELYGLDLTAWSPPHILIALAGAALIISPIGLLSRAYPKEGRPAWVTALIVGSLAVMLNLLMLVGVAEWEWSSDRLSPLVAQRPIWLFPVVAGGLAYFTLIVGKLTVRGKWTATITAAGFYALRFGIMGAMAAMGFKPLAFPLVFLAGAVAIDLLWGRVNLWLLTAAYAVTFVLPTLPLLERWPTFDTMAAVTTAAVLATTGILFASAARAAARALVTT